MVPASDRRRKCGSDPVNPATRSAGTTHVRSAALMPLRRSAIARLTVKLRVRPGAPEQTPRAHNLFRARGDTTDSHGTLERWLGGGGDGARANGCFKIR